MRRRRLAAVARVAKARDASVRMLRRRGLHAAAEAIRRGLADAVDDYSVMRAYVAGERLHYIITADGGCALRPRPLGAVFSGAKP